jgi:hypothetical protein
MAEYMVVGRIHAVRTKSAASTSAVLCDVINAVAEFMVSYTEPAASTSAVLCDFINAVAEFMVSYTDPAASTSARDVHPTRHVIGSHACKSFKRSKNVKRNSNSNSNSNSKGDVISRRHTSTVPSAISPSGSVVAKGGWLLEREECRTFNDNSFRIGGRVFSAGSFNACHVGLQSVQRCVTEGMVSAGSFNACHVCLQWIDMIYDEKG